MRQRWKPNVTVAAVIEHEGRFLLVEEQTSDGLRINNPAGHLDPGESLVQACAREVLEETAHAFEPRALVGVYRYHLQRPATATTPSDGGVTYLRFTFTGQLGARDPARRLDHGIVRTLWMNADEIRASVAQHRTPALLRCVEDYVAGLRFPLDLLRPELELPPGL